MALPMLPIFCVTYSDIFSSFSRKSKVMRSSGWPYASLYVGIEVEVVVSVRIATAMHADREAVRIPRRRSPASTWCPMLGVPGGTRRLYDRPPVEHVGADAAAAQEAQAAVIEVVLVEFVDQRLRRPRSRGTD